jgi:hypothetical protein
MLAKTSHLKGFVIRATDGELGTVDQFLFDDDTWCIRLSHETGGWLGGRRVLITPISAAHTDLEARRLDVALMREQVEKSPISTPTGPFAASTRPNTSGITGIRIIGPVPICGAQPSIRQVW